MNRKAQFHSVLTEIRNALGAEATYREVLECAELVIRTLGEKSEVCEVIEDDDDLMELKPLYELFEEDPWKIFLSESSGFYIDDFESYQIKRNYLTV